MFGQSVDLVYGKNVMFSVRSLQCQRVMTNYEFGLRFFQRTLPFSFSYKYYLTLKPIDIALCLTLLHYLYSCIYKFKYTEEGIYNIISVTASIYSV